MEVHVCQGASDTSAGRKKDPESVSGTANSRGSASALAQRPVDGVECIA